MSMKTYTEVFKKSKENNEGIFIPFLVAGDPDYDTSMEKVFKMQTFVHLTVV